MIGEGGLGDDMMRRAGWDGVDELGCYIGRGRGDGMDGMWEGTI